MKKLLSILGAITLIGTSSTSLVSCNKNEYTAEKLKELKERNKIDTTNKTIRDNLEGMASQETPFNKVDNKGYYVVGKTNNGNITKFKNNTLIDRGHPRIEIDSKKADETYKLNLEGMPSINTLIIRSQSVISDGPAPRFKYVYRGNLDTKEPDLILAKDGNLKVKGE